MTGRSIADLIAAAAPSEGRPLVDLTERLSAAGMLVAPPAAIGDESVSGGVAYDSRHMQPGAIFVAVVGVHADGHDFAAAAAARGAVAAVVERPIAGLAIPQLVVAASRSALAEAACWWFGDPSRELDVVGITGTDGKTTTSYLAAGALAAAGLRPGMLGTIETRIGGHAEPDVEHQTTPEAPELQGALRAMVAAGDLTAVIETTSHGLALDRVAGIAYDAAIFTNLSHEHLELHGTYEAYRAAKLGLFEGLAPAGTGHRPPVGIVNGDDPEAGRFSVATRAAGARLITYGAGDSVDVRASAVVVVDSGVRFKVTTDGWSSDIGLRLRGRFNVHNALAVVALGRAWDLDPESVRHGLESVSQVPGRMEWIDRGQPFGVLVDFAHSPASLGVVLDEVGPAALSRGGTTIVVFGSAGERDTEKRPLMGRVAAERAGLIIVTDEDPRGEDGDAIVDEIAAGSVAAGRRRGVDLLVIRDRRAAIEEAFGRARAGDIVVLAGKGHERSIIGPGGPHAWNEAAVARELLGAMGYARET